MNWPQIIKYKRPRPEKPEIVSVYRHVLEATLLPETEPPPFVQVHSWDEYLGTKATEKPLSLLPASQQDATFSTPPIDPKQAAENGEWVSKGLLAQGFEFDEDRLCFTVSRQRIQGLSSVATMGFLQACAECGSYFRRLEYTIRRISELEPDRVLVAFSAAFEAILYNHQASSLECLPTTLQKTTAILSQRNTLRTVCRVIGCEDLHSRVHLNSVPTAVEVLNVAYNECTRLKSDPVVHPIVWDLSEAVIRPWEAQLFLAVGLNLETNVKQLLEQPKIYIPDLFWSYRNELFAVDEKSIPAFMPLRYAYMTIECLNCRIVSGALDPYEPSTVGSWDTSDPFAQPEPHHKILEQATKQKYRDCRYRDFDEFIMHLLGSIGRQNAKWNLSARKALLQNHLRQHFALICQVGLLQNGLLWMYLREKLADWSDRPSEMDIALVNDYLYQVLPNFPPEIRSCIAIGLQRDVDLVQVFSDNITVLYDVPRHLKAIIDRRVVRAVRRAFSALLDLQQRCAASSQTKHDVIDLNEQLYTYAVHIQDCVKKLEDVITSSFTFDMLRRQFHIFAEHIVRFETN